MEAPPFIDRTRFLTGVRDWITRRKRFRSGRQIFYSKENSLMDGSSRVIPYFLVSSLCKKFYYVLEKKNVLT